MSDGILVATGLQATLREHTHRSPDVLRDWTVRRQASYYVVSDSTFQSKPPVIDMLARAARPKLALAVPTAPVPSLAVKSPLLRTPISPSPISPTVRNTKLNQRGASTLQVPTFAYAQNPGTKSILKKQQASSSAIGKKLQFREEPAVRCVTPVPEDYHGTYIKMSRDERRWGKA
ncbi:MAG: hypothetical protein Q9222_000455 [Ikaeria aurantiellina]